MKNPSSHWIADLIRVIQECHAETDMDFGQFLQETFAGMDLNSPDYDLVQALKNKFNT